MGIDAEMFVRTMASVTEKEVRKAAVAACSVFGANRFFLMTPQRAVEWQDLPRHAFEIVKSIEQDGPTIEPEPGETFIQVHLQTRYWGPGYERGDLAFIVTLAAWLERRFPESEVWYGGDSSGVLHERLGRRLRAEMIAHAAGDHGADYRIGSPMSGTPVQRCAFCADAPMSECRWGCGKVGFHCCGCGLYRLVSEKTGHVEGESYGRWPDEEKGARS